MARGLLSAVESCAQSAPDRVVLEVRQSGSWVRWSSAELRDAVSDWAARFSVLALPPGSVVFIVLEHRADLYPIFLGAMRAGLIPSFLPFPTVKQDPTLYWESHRTLFGRVEPRCIVTYSRNLPPIAEVTAGLACTLIDADTPPPVPNVDLPALSGVEREDAIALLQHSSGTTGLKKGVTLTFGQIARQVESYAQAIGATAEDCIVSWLPLYHDMGLISSFLMPLTLGCRIVSIGAFDWLARPDQLLRLIAEHRATLCWMPNFAFNHLVRTRDKSGSYDLSSMRALISCSEPSRAETVERFRSSFAPHGLRAGALQVCYAMAETVFAVTETTIGEEPRLVSVDRSLLAAERRLRPLPADDPGAARFVSCGRPIEGIEIRIDADPGCDTGEIQLRGSFLFAGYYRNAEATASAFEDGWYRTGDVGFIDGGELFVCGRTKEMLIVHGRNYYANDIEGIASEVDGVKPGRVVAFGVADHVTASEEAVLLAEAASDDIATHPELEKRLKQAVFDRLELALKKVMVVPPGQVIKTTSGKVSRKENIARYLQMQDA